MAASYGNNLFHNRKGTAAIEYAIVVPVLFSLVFGIIDSARLVWTYASLSRAVQTAARCAALDSTACGTVTQVRTAAVVAAPAITVVPSTFSVRLQPCGIEVAADIPFTFTVVALGSTSIHASACYPK